MYTSLNDLTGDRHFEAAGVKVSGTPFARTGQLGEHFGSGIEIDYSEATESYTLTSPTGDTVTFSPSDKLSILSYPVMQWSKTNGTVTDSLTLLAPGTTGPMRYTASGQWNRNDSGPAGNQTHFFVTGAPTFTADMPLSGTASYALRTAGSAVDHGVLYNVYAPDSTVTFSANFATGAIATSLHLYGRAPVGVSPSEALGFYTGTGSMASGGPGFSGTLSDTGISGTFSGAFFGPQAIEVGFGWELHSANFNAQGFAVGLSLASAAQAYRKLDELTGDQYFSASGISFAGAATAPTNMQASGFVIDYDAGTNSYGLKAPSGETALLAPSNQVIDPSLPSNVMRWSSTSGTITDILTRIIPGVNGVMLKYTMIDTWAHLDSGPGDDKFRYVVAGVGTGLDMPVTGTATYSFLTGGIANDNGTLYSIEGTAPNGTFAINFANGTIATSLTLNGTPNGGGSLTSLGTYNGTGSVISGSTTFTGTFTGSSLRTGIFSGAFFGPAAAEVGYAWEVHGTNFNAQGVGAGLKN